MRSDPRSFKYASRCLRADAAFVARMVKAGVFGRGAGAEAPRLLSLRAHRRPLLLLLLLVAAFLLLLLLLQLLFHATYRVPKHTLAHTATCARTFFFFLFLKHFVCCLTFVFARWTWRGRPRRRTCSSSRPTTCAARSSRQPPPPPCATPQAETPRTHKAGAASGEV